MPHIKAYYKVGIGYNAIDRKKQKKYNKTPPSLAIKKKALVLGCSIMRETIAPTPRAEAQALAKLLNLMPAVDFAEVRFCLISDVYFVWEPCRNCSAQTAYSVSMVG